MALKVFLAASLRKYVPGYDGDVGHEVETSPGMLVRDIANRIGIPEDEVKLIMVDGIGAKWQTPVEGAERLAFFPPVGGG